jgi:hypothetical protein
MDDQFAAWRIRLHGLTASLLVRIVDYILWCDSITVGLRNESDPVTLPWRAQLIHELSERRARAMSLLQAVQIS